jgi:hypothetical protein
MKWRKIIFCFILFFNSVSLFAVPKIGCSTYQGLYPNPSMSNNSSTSNPYYENTDYIRYRFSEEDKGCGLRDTKFSAVGGACDVKGVRNYGALVSYDTNDVMPCSLDSCLIFFAGLTSALGIIVIRKKHSHIL